MDWERWFGFAVFLIVVVAVGFVLRRRLVRARKTGDDPIYAIASLDGDAGYASPQARPESSRRGSE